MKSDEYYKNPAGGWIILHPWELESQMQSIQHDNADDENSSWSLEQDHQSDQVKTETRMYHDRHKTKTQQDKPSQEQSNSAWSNVDPANQRRSWNRSDDPCQNNK